MDGEPDWLNELREQTRRRREPWVLIEGRQALEAAVAGWWDLAGILASEACDWEPPDWSGLEILRRPSEELEGVEGYSFHRGVLGLARQPDESADVAGLMSELDAEAVVVVCPRLADAANVGAIIRNASALGAKAVIFGKEGASPFEREAIRASAAAVFRLPVRVADAGQILRCLKTGKFELVGIAPGDGSVPLAGAEFETGRLGLVIGSEDEGLGSFWRAACDSLVHLPMGSDSESLNVAAASAVLLWEITRRRQMGADGLE